ncbi:hypothetical protein SAMN04487897_10316 [Paenibacillus sp. yr247]|nr:hypothetical protein SAMN04487897_10316 [Paenibacillus sp. yr247]
MDIKKQEQELTKREKRRARIVVDMAKMEALRTQLDATVQLQNEW